MINEVLFKGFGIHKKLRVKFDAGVNAIIGDNRKGKTHIMEGICYGLYGKTKNSVIKRIINFESKQAQVNLFADTFKVQRERTPSTSKLTKITKIELDKKLNLSYQEFLSIFYISSHEQKSLFDPAYLRKFLITLFDLEKYSRRFEELKMELRALKSVQETEKKVNKKLLVNRFNRVKKIAAGFNAKVEKAEKLESELQKEYRALSEKLGTVNAKRAEITKKIALMQEGKCSKCKRPFKEENVKATMTKGEEGLKKIEVIKTVIRKKTDALDKKSERIESAVRAYERKVSRCRRILTVLKERAKESESRVDKKRIAELEEIIPVFAPTGFPSYLLKIYLPVITETANNLLKTVFPDLSLTVRTERPESNKPDFKPIIKKRVGENVEVQEMKDLCGSECAVVNLCFRLGIMVIFRQLCKTDVDFMLFDESFEKLDDNNSIQILTLFENFISMGYLKQVILVTHKAVLKQQESINYIGL